MTSSSPSSSARIQVAQRPSDLENQDLRATITVLSERIGQLLLSEYSAENEAAIDRIDDQLSELRFEQEARARGSEWRLVDRGGAEDGVGDNTDAEGDILDIRSTYDGRRRITVTSGSRDPNPHIPITHVKRDANEKVHRHNGNHQTEPSSDPDPHKPPIQPRNPNETPKKHSQTEERRSPQPAPSPALTSYTTAFPHGHSTIPTPGRGLLCGFSATTLTMHTMHPNLPTPTVPALQAIFNSPLYAHHARGFQLTNHNNFHVDQVGLVLFLWGREQGLNLQVGYLPEGGEPQLVPHPNAEGTVVVWIFHLEAGGEDEVGHFEGMRRREGGGEVRRGVHRRAWVRRLDHRLSDELRRWNF